MRSRILPLAAALVLGIVTVVVINHFVVSDASGQAAAPAATATEVTKAICVVQPLGNSKVAGKVVFTKVADGVEIAAELSGLAPGEHGFHVHEFGDCSMADGVCAGGHFNPEGKPHGRP